MSTHSRGPMLPSEVDLFVIGGGSGGLAASKRAASHGARVILAEGDRLGGTCVIRGCIPKKLMAYASHMGELIELSEHYGWQLRSEGLRWERLVDARNTVVSRLESNHERLLSEAGVTLVRARARMLDGHSIEVCGQRVKAAHVLLCTGAVPTLPEFEGVELALSSDGFFEQREPPRSALIVGGGYIAVEFAGILHGLGIPTTLAVRSKLLRDFDHEIGERLAEAMTQQGIRVCLGERPLSLARSSEGLRLRTETASGMSTHEAATCMVIATGRHPNTQDLGLEDAGVELGARGEVLVNEHHETRVKGVWAVGDLTDKATLTPVAIKAGRTVADRLFGGSEAVMSYDGIPTAVFSHPPVGAVGLSEAEARGKYGDDVKVYRAGFSGLLYAMVPEEKRVKTFMKMVVQTSTDRVLGLHMLGPDAPEIIQGFAVALKAGATKRDFDATVAIHPSSAEEFVLMR